MSVDKEKAAAAKALGNAALTQKRFEDAVKHYTDAIAADPTDHIFYSNRSAAYLSMGDADSALKDGKKCIEIAPRWGKGFGRVGAAYVALGKQNEAIDAYNKGLEVEPSDALREGLDQAIAMSKSGSGFGGMPSMGSPLTPEILQRAMGDPRFAGHFMDPTFQKALGEFQKDPNAMQTLVNAMMNPGSSKMDPRVLELVQFGLGMSMKMNEDDEAPKPRSSTSSSSTSSKQKEKADPIEASVDASLPPEERAAIIANKRAALAEKEKGNALYKAKDFNGAIACYEKAFELDADFTFLLNKAAALFEMGDLDACDALCSRIVEDGRAAQAPFSIIAKAFFRRGNVAYRRGDLDGAIEQYDNSLLEHRTDEVYEKKKKVAAEKKKAEELAYLDPVKAEEAKDRGNERFKAGDFKAAIAEYSEAIKRAPTEPKYFTNRATAKTKLMDFSGALADAEAALKLDPKNVKALVKKGNAEAAMKELHKAMVSFQMALDLDPSNAEAKDGYSRVVSKINAQEDDPERAQRAMSDPEIQAILRDPNINILLENAQSDPNVLAKALKDPLVASKLQKLIAAGILRIG